MSDLKLIQLVKDQPSIYDKTNIYYNNKPYVGNVWKGIAREMHQSLIFCQKRWRYLRDYFVRQLHMSRNNPKQMKPIIASTSSSRKTSNWNLFDSLFFLAPFSSTRKPIIKQINNQKSTTNLQQNFKQENDNMTILSTNSNLYESTSLGLDFSHFLSPSDFRMNLLSNMAKNDRLNNNTNTNSNKNNKMKKLQLNSNHLNNQQKFNDHEQQQRNEIRNIYDTETDENLIQMEQQPVYDHDQYQQQQNDEQTTTHHHHHQHHQHHQHQQQQQHQKRKEKNSVKKDKLKTSEVYRELLTILRQSDETYQCDEHEHFFKSLLTSVRKIDEDHIMPFRTEILQIIMKYRYMSQGDKLTEPPNGTNSDVIVIDTGELHWRQNLSKY